MRTANTYVLTFSVRRLVELLSEAGFDIRPGAGIRGGLVQFVSTPPDREVFVEWAAGLDMPWERVTGEESKERQTETTQPGAYL
jgi:arsenate reductase-like glutaredoxin family protein